MQHNKQYHRKVPFSTAFKTCVDLGSYLAWLKFVKTFVVSCRETDELLALVEFLESKSEVNPKEIALEKRQEMKKKGEIKSPGKKKGKKGAFLTTETIQWSCLRLQMPKLEPLSVV